MSIYLLGQFKPCAIEHLNSMMRVLLPVLLCLGSCATSDPGGNPAVSSFAAAGSSESSKDITVTILIDFPRDQMGLYYGIKGPGMNALKKKIGEIAKVKEKPHTVFSGSKTIRLKSWDNGWPNSKELEDALKKAVREFNREFSGGDRRRWFFEPFPSATSDDEFLLTPGVLDELIDKEPGILQTDVVKKITCVRLEWVEGKLKAIYNYELNPAAAYDPKNLGLSLNGTTPVYCIVASFDVVRD